jgi:glycosyltransferase involved in cell wall biosynthesis
MIKKIAVDGSVFSDELTGVGNYCAELLKEWAKLRSDIEFVVYAPFELQTSFTQKNISIKKPFFKKTNRFNRPKKLIWFQLYLPFAILLDKCDTFWCGNGMVSLINFKPFLLTVHDFVYLRFPETMHPISLRHRSLLQPYGIKRAKWIVTNSQATADEMVEIYGREADTVVYPSVDKQFYPREAVEIKSVVDKYEVPDSYNLIVGTIEPRKNLLLFLEIYLDVAKKKALKPLVIIGRSGWRNEEIHRVIDEGMALGIFHTTGYMDREDMPALFSGASVYFMPSLYEGFGMPILEARKCGTAVICSDIPAMKEAGGSKSIYHEPTKEGISEVLDKLADGELELISDFGASFVESWEDGAKKMDRLIC